MKYFLDYLIETLEWAKLETGSFLTISAMICSSGLFITALCFRAYFTKYQAAIDRWASADREMKELRRIVEIKNSRLKLFDPKILLQEFEAMSISSQSPSRVEFIDNYFNRIKDTISTLSYHLAVDRRGYLQNDGLTALEEAKRLIQFGLAADPQNSKLSIELKNLSELSKYVELQGLEPELLKVNNIKSLDKFRLKISSLGYDYLCLLLSERLVDLSIEKHGFMSESTAIALGDVGYFNGSIGNYKEMRECYDEAIRIMEELGSIDTYNYASLISNYGGSLINSKDLVYSEKLVKKAIELDGRLKFEEKSFRPGILHNYARILSAKNSFVEAENYYKDAINITRKLYGSNDHRLLASLYNYGDMLKKAGRFEDSRAVLTHVFQTHQQNYPTDSSIAMNYRTSLYEILVTHFPDDELISSLMTDEHGLDIEGEVFRVEPLKEA